MKRILTALALSFLFSGPNIAYAAVTFPVNGGTGTATTPTYGQLLVGNAGGTYTVSATSTLGIGLTDTTGVLPIAKGGTNDTGFSSGGVVYFDGTRLTASNVAGQSIVFASSNLGVGSSSPSQRLSVQGKGFFASAVTASNYIATTTGNVFPDLTLNTLGVPAGQFAAFDPTGKLIGTTTPAGGGGGSGTVGTGTTGQVPYYAANGTTLTATSSLLISTSGNIHMGTTNCSLGLAGNLALGAEICGNTGVAGGLVLQIENDSAATTAFSGLNFDNDQSSTLFTFAGLFFNSSTYGYTGYGTALAVPSNLSIENTQGSVTSISATTSPSGSFFNWLTLGANTGNEVMRLTSAGNLGIGTATPQGKLQIATPTNAANAVSVTNAAGSTTASFGTIDTAGPIFSVASSTGQSFFHVNGTGDIFFAGTSTPVISSCGTSPSVTGGPMNFTIQVGSVAATGCTASFSHTLPQAPVCNVSERTGSITNILNYTVSTTAIVVSQTGLTGDILDVNCFLGSTT